MYVEGRNFVNTKKFRLPYLIHIRVILDKLNNYIGLEFFFVGVAPYCTENQ